MNRALHIVIVTLGVLFGPCSSYAQQWETVDPGVLRECLQRNDRQYAAMSNMKLTTVILAYQNAGDAAPSDQGRSVVWRMGDQYKAEHLGMTTYQNKDLRVLIDPDQRTIFLSAPTDINASMRGVLQDSLLAKADKVGRATLGDGTHFRLKFGPRAVYGLVEIDFDKAGWLRHVDLYWAQAVPIDPSDPASAVVYPKVSMALGVPERIAPETVETDPSSVVAWRNGKPVALGIWKEYSVFDTRPQ
jgi:hypothetical protein